MNVVDSSAWIEYYTGGPNAQYFSAAILDREALIVPAICLYEVFKWVLMHRSESDALTAATDMQQSAVIPVHNGIALSAARLSVELRLPMADSLVLATAHEYEAILWTQDENFKNLPGVRFKQRKT